jgi:hypothetical protein
MQKNRAAVRIFVPALASAALWGTWAYFANRAHAPSALRAGLVQALTSFVFTVVGALILESLYRLFARKTWRKTLSATLGAGLSLASMLAIHALNHTPNLLLTVLPVWALVLVYCSVYVQAIERAQQTP